MDHWKTFGHKSLKNILELQLASGKFPHAYLFVGPGGIGKKTLALELAGKILGSVNAIRHADFSLLDGEGEITLLQTQQFMENLSLKPFAGEKKVAIINNAHLMNVQSGNALLKTLEEPSPSTVLILISNNKDLLPTIISRCQTFFLSGFSIAELREYAAKNNLPANEEILELSFGSVARLIDLQNETKFKEQETKLEEYKKIKSYSEAQRLLAVSEFADLETVDLKSLFTLWMYWQKNRLLENSKSAKALDQLLKSLLQLSTNKNKKLILQELFLNV